MLNPHFVAGEHGLFGAHKSEDIRTIFTLTLVKVSICFIYNITPFFHFLAHGAFPKVKH